MAEVMGDKGEGGEGKRGMGRINFLSTTTIFKWRSLMSEIDKQNNLKEARCKICIRAELHKHNRTQKNTPL